MSGAMPEITPVCESIFNPGGKFPLGMLNEYGPVPPVMPSEILTASSLINTPNCPDDCVNLG